MLVAGEGSPDKRAGAPTPHQRSYWSYSQLSLGLLHLLRPLSLLPARASEQGNVIGSVRIYNSHYI